MTGSAVQAGLSGSDGGFATANFSDAAETALYDAVSAALPDLASANNNGDVEGALRRLSQLGPVIDAYFDAVLVNSDDEAVRDNRHAFLAAIFALFSQYADFSHIVESGRVAAG